MKAWCAVLKLAWQELQRGGLANLQHNVRERLADEEVELQRIMVGAPRIEFDGRVRVAPPLCGWDFHEVNRTGRARR